MKYSFKLIMFVFPFFVFSACNNSKKSENSENVQNTNTNNHSNNGNNSSPVPNSSQTATALSQFNSTQLSQALGTANLGNTCFANSVHKILWQYLGESFVSASAPSNNILQVNFYKFLESLNARKHLLKNNMLHLESEFNKDPYFSSSLDQIFDNVRDELIARGGTGDIGGSILKVHQASAATYLQDLLEIIDFSSIHDSFYKPFYIYEQPINSASLNGTPTPVHTNSQGHVVPNSFLNLKNLLNKKVSSFQENIEAYLNDDPHLPKYLVVNNLSDIPNKIIFSIRRNFLNMGMLKSTDRLEFLDNISLRFYNTNLTTSLQKNFKIKGFILHRGITSIAGHYFVYIQDNGVWYKHNDSQVTAVSSQADLHAMKEHFELESVIYLFEAE